jgi:putative transcriptional regulator
MPPRIRVFSEGGTLAHQLDVPVGIAGAPRSRQKASNSGAHLGDLRNTREDVVESANLAPGLLLAMPQLSDPNFKRAVVLMIEHSANGSFGLVINHPSPITAHELLDSLHMNWRGEDSAVVWAGGPVSPSTGWVLHEPVVVAQPGQGTIAITSSISLSTSPDRLRAIANQPPRNIRLLLGYSGWGPGQLEAEMSSGAWLHASADPKLIFDTPADHMWDHAMRSLGINPESLFVSRGVN